MLCLVGNGCFSMNLENQCIHHSTVPIDSNANNIEIYFFIKNLELRKFER